jgi:murein DD-endopeptidase MepM/ murein hydrolase activator NlpD
VRTWLIGLFLGGIIGASGNSQAQSPPSQTRGHDAGCACGTRQMHFGIDWTAKEGSAVRVADDGVVVRLEEDESAAVYTQTGGFCGRYVVVKHGYPNGRVVFTRYAQLGRLVGGDDKPLRVGMQVKSRDKVGEVGKRGLFHFEVRPADQKAVDRGPEWPRIYGSDPTMEWARFLPVDPATFDFAAFAGKK